MNLHWIDWAIVIFMVVSLIIISAITKKYIKNATDFLAANRLGGRYLLTLGEGMAALGAITIVANFEKFYHAGFAAMWWGSMLAPMGLIIALSGWVTYRYRETRAMTMAQFFEIRYSRNFRLFAGITAWLSGLLNYGIFPAITARFFIYFCNIPQYFVDIGIIKLNLTLGIIMFILLSIAVYITFSGGQISIMFTDFFQGQFVNIAFLIIITYLLVTFGWSNIIDNLKTLPKGKSMLNPFDQGEIPDFTFSFFAIQAFLALYGYMAWQGNQGFNCAAKNPHEARMSRILGMWRANVTYLSFALLPICAYIFLNNVTYSSESSIVTSALTAIDDPQIRSQVTVPVALQAILPVGITGIFCAVILAAAISTDDTYLHSWGSIFIQDVVMPLRKKELTPAQHLKLLRYSTIGVSIFAWIYSMIFPLKDYVFMYLSITAAIFVGGAGSVIIGGLYWKRGTTAGAWASMITGIILSGGGILLQNVIWPSLVPKLNSLYPNSNFLLSLPKEFPLNGQELSFIAGIGAIAAYIMFSLFTKSDPKFSMDKMLHRGIYAIKDEHFSTTSNPTRGLKAIGIGKEFTRGDKIIYIMSLGWTSFWFFAFTIGTTYHFIFGSTNDGWAKWWLFQIGLSAAAAIITIIWFICGGTRDIIYLYKTLAKIKRNDLDNGRVVKHHNIADEVTVDSL